MKIILKPLFFAAILSLLVTACRSELPPLAETMEDEEAAQKIDNILAAVDAQFHPGDTALQVYGRLSRHVPRDNTNEEPPPE